MSGNQIGWRRPDIPKSWSITAVKKVKKKIQEPTSVRMTAAQAAREVRDQDAGESAKRYSDGSYRCRTDNHKVRPAIQKAPQ